MPLPGRKYFFFDIDGTLTNDADHRIVPSAQRALHALEQNGHFVAIATGRAHYKAISFTNSIDIHSLVCAGGGCLVINDRIIVNHTLNHDLAMDLIHHADQAGMGWLAMIDDSDKVLMKDMKFLEQAGLRTELTTYVLDETMDPAVLPIYKIYLAITPEQEKTNPWINKAGWLRMEHGYITFQYDEKKKGILEMMDALHHDPKDVVVFGDGKNDLVMFDPLWFSIAMGNGAKALKKKADYVTAANVDDGIWKACAHFGWIHQK
ncbi:MAG: HAD-IIB family hydrolase [Lactimicrobium sp.]|jgi:Cof subfamily protein (haloacid dehalogenase superfamily)|uniref:HAD-IIB family hydrolase n=1 Tax=Lactimicrobium sp. TaxID=2563780 RepID=UPI002F357C70